MNYAEIKRLDVANSPGIGATLFVSGCNFHCKGCFNEEAQNFNYGKLWTKEVEDEFIGYLKSPYVVNANLLGGEVMQQDSETILHLVKRIKNETNVKIWLWSGYLFETLLSMPDKKEILEYIDFLVDGQFKLELKDPKLKYRGSANQRVIDVQASLTNDKIVTINVD